MTVCAACDADVAHGGGVRDGRVWCLRCLHPPVQTSMFDPDPAPQVTVTWDQLRIGDAT